MRVSSCFEMSVLRKKYQRAGIFGGIFCRPCSRQIRRVFGRKCFRLFGTSCDRPHRCRLDIRKRCRRETCIPRFEAIWIIHMDVFGDYAVSVHIDKSADKRQAMYRTSRLVDFLKQGSAKVDGRLTPLLISLSFDSKNVSFVFRAGWLRTALVLLLVQCSTNPVGVDRIFWKEIPVAHRRRCFSLHLLNLLCFSIRRSMGFWCASTPSFIIVPTKRKEHA